MTSPPPAPARPGAAGWRSAGVLLLALLVLVSALLSVSLGSVNIPLSTTLEAVWRGVRGLTLGGDEVIVWQLRLPRVVLGLLVGASLSVCGAAFQGVFRNPLADPYLMGAASGAALGATLVFVLGLASALLPPAALTGALISVLAALLLAREGRRLPPARLVLSGVVVGSLLSAGGTYLLLQHQDSLQRVFAFTLGNLAFAGWGQVAAVLPYAALGGGALLLLARPLDTLQLGDLTARTLGLPVERLRLAVIVAGSLCTAAAVSYAGIIGFVGLVTPHLMRRLFGPGHRSLLPLSALAGAGLLVLSDLLARTLLRPQELPVGLLTTLLGGPFFLALLRRQRG